MHPIRALQTFARGESYWRVVLSTGRTYSQLDMSYDAIRGKRPIDWYLDLCATGDVLRIRELWIHTPRGDAALKISEPGTAYQLNAAGLLLDISGSGSGRQRDAQIIGRVDDKETGQGVAFIWDVHTKQLYKDEQANVRNFAGWRPGVAPLGALALQNMGLRL